MLGETKTLDLTKRILSYSTAGQTEVVIQSADTALTRFANSYIHQNVAESDCEARVRVALGKKIGVAATNDLSTSGLRKVVESAVSIARLQPDNPAFISLPGPAGSYASIPAFVEKTARVTPLQRAKGAGVICRKCVEVGLTGSGAITTSVNELAVANSLGVSAYFAATRCDVNTVVMSDSGSGYAEAAALDFDALDFEAIGAEAIGKAEKSRNPQPLAPGDYAVILEEAAVADIVHFLAFLGFSALAVQEGRSFMKLGEKVVGENISIWDDPLDLQGSPMPFDFEGVPKARLSLIERGIAKGLAYDTYTAGKERKQSTGHALPAPNTFGPLPLNVTMNTGKNSKEEMLKSTKRGLWVTRFHYTRPVHPLKVIVTGMTRDGTFLIEDGQLTQPIRNLRFTQGYLDALSNVEMIGSTAKTITGMLGASRVPALKIGSFTFTGATEF